MKVEEFNELMKKHHEEDQKYLKERCEKIEDKWICKKCGSTLLAFKIAHPVHNGFSMFGGSHAGAGRCEYEERPYCPKCDGEKAENLGYSFHGACIDY